MEGMRLACLAAMGTCLALAACPGGGSPGSDARGGDVASDTPRDVPDGGPDVWLDVPVPRDAIPEAADDADAGPVPASCCRTPSDCGTDAVCARPPGTPATGFGVCRPAPESRRCWTQRDCGPDEECHGAGFCGCHVDCDLAWDGPGVCAPIGSPCCPIDPAWVAETCDAASRAVFDGIACVQTCPGCCGCEPFCDLTFDSIEACQAACVTPR